MSNSEQFAPIHEQVSILDFVRRHLGADGLSDPAMPLLDDAPTTPGGIGFMAGAFENVLAPTIDEPEIIDRAATAIDLLTQAAASPSAAHLVALYSHLNNHQTIDYIDELINGVRRQASGGRNLAETARWLAERSPDRGPTKVGIALMGVCGKPDPQTLRDLGSHEAFTLFVVVAFQNQDLVDAEQEIFELAHRVHGWGRINCVQRLRTTVDPEIKSWILLQGFRNQVMNEYLAYIAATTGGLLTALTADIPSPETFQAAGEILTSLLMGGPAEDIDDYADGPAAVDRYVELAADYQPSVDLFLKIGSVSRFLNQADGWSERLSKTWTTAHRETLRQRCQSIIDRPVWPRLIDIGLSSDDDKEFWSADQAARRTGIDTFAQILARLTAEPLTHGWSRAWEQANELGRAHQLLQLLERQVDLANIGTGATPNVGLGPGFKPHTTLQWTLQALKRFPGQGQAAIAAGLQSPSTQNRNAALAALDQWERFSVPENLLALVSTVAAADPDEKTRARALLLTATD